MAVGDSFRKLADNLGELATVPSRVARAVAEDFNALLQDEFDQEQDPYGDDWAELAESTIRKKGHDTIMFETGETREQTRAHALQGAGIGLETTDKAGFNMFDGDDRPGRPVLPAGDELPEEWQEAIARRFSEAVARGRKQK
jgi:hypothetical protein